MSNTSPCLLLLDFIYGDNHIIRYILYYNFKALFLCAVYLVRAQSVCAGRWCRVKYWSVLTKVNDLNFSLPWAWLAFEKEVLRSLEERNH